MFDDHSEILLKYFRKCGELLATVVIEDFGALQLNSTVTPRPQSVPPVWFAFNCKHISILLDVS